ncbi:MAG: VCBS repeat-containing protein [Bacteroidota bacterium]
MPTVRGDFRLFPLASLIGLMIAAQPFIFSQHQSTPTLSRVQECTLDSKIHFPVFVHSASRQHRDIVYFDAGLKNISMVRYQFNGIYGQSFVIDTITVVSSMSAGDINNDGFDDIVVVQREYSRVILFISNKNDSIYRRQYFTVGFYPEQALIEDLSGDGNNDIIVYGKLSSGISVIRGRGSSVFNEAKTIFPDVPISSFSVIRLNGDDIPDVVVHNWLTNEDIFYFGLGGLQFSEQAALSYGADSTATLFEDVNNDNITDAIVTSTQYQSLLVYHSDGLGNFTREQSVSLMGTASSLQRTAFTKGSVPDILLSNTDTQQFSVLLNKQDGTFYDEIVFGIPYLRYSIFSEDINGDGFTDVICFDKDSSRYRIYWNQSTVLPDSFPAAFAAGKDPNNIFVSDIDADGFDDIIVSNRGSHTVSMLFGSVQGLSSQISFEIPDSPSSVTLYAKTDSSLTLITSHGEESKIGVTTVLYQRNPFFSLYDEIESYTITLAGKPSHILPDISLNNTSLSLYAFLRGQTNAIVFYQQLQGTQFIAKSLTPLIPSRIMFATISDLNGDGYTDLVYIYNDKRVGKDLIGATLNDEKGGFTGSTYTITLPDTGHRRSYLWVEDLNADQKADYVFYSYPEKSLYVVLAQRNGDFTDLVKIESNVSLSHQDQLKFYDMNGDGIEDLVYVDSELPSVNVLRSKGNGTFYPKQKIQDLPADIPFSCGDVNGDGIPDVIIPLQKKNCVEVRYGKKF